MTNSQATAYTKQLLRHYPFVYCPTLAGCTTNHTPHVGDVVLFYSGGSYCHTGWVYAVDSSRFYTIEGNTSGGSSIIANGGMVCKKQYNTSSYTASKFFRPDYSSLVSAGIYASTGAAISAITGVASAEVGYMEKQSNASLDSKTANAGSANFTKYWRDIYPSYQGQPWCAAFITWIFVKALEAAGTGTGSTGGSGNGLKTTYANTAKSLSIYGTARQWASNGVTHKIYCDSAARTQVGTLDPGDTAAVIGRQDGMTIVAYNLEGEDNLKVGFVAYAGGSSGVSNSQKTWKNSGASRTAYADSNCSLVVGSLNANESCDCLGTLGGRYILLYPVDDTSYHKVGLVSYRGGL